MTRDVVQINPVTNPGTLGARRSSHRASLDRARILTYPMLHPRTFPICTCHRQQEFSLLDGNIGSLIDPIEDRGADGAGVYGRYPLTRLLGSEVWGRESVSMGQDFLDVDNEQAARLRRGRPCCLAILFD